MNKHRLWTWLNLNLLIGTVPPRVLYYLNRLIAKQRGSSLSPGTNNDVFRSVFQHEIFRAGGHDQGRKRGEMSAPEFLGNGYLRSDAGLVAFKSLPTSPLLPDYLECQLEGLRYFDGVFRGQRPHPSSFSAMMIEHHRILATGLHGTRSYRVRRDSEEHSSNIAGKLRSPNGRVACAVIDKDMINAVLRALTEIAFYPVEDWNIAVDGIPTEAWSGGSRVRKGFQITHPDGSHIPLYFSRMEQCLALIQQVSANTDANGNEDRDLLLQALATYFHLGIHAHAFVRINQSLLWAQVNYVLMLNRLRPVHHGYVDLAAAFLNIGSFRDYFKRHILAHNNLQAERR